MSVDISGPLRSLLSDSLANARGKEEAGDASGAAAAYAQVAILYRQLAEQTRDVGLRNNRLDLADRYKTKADTLKTKIGKPLRDSADDEDSGKIDAEIEGLIHKSTVFLGGF